MSEIRVNKVINEAGTGAVELTQGATLPSGKTISGSGIAVNSSGTAAGLSGTPVDVTVNDVTLQVKYHWCGYDPNWCINL